MSTALSLFSLHEVVIATLRVHTASFVSLKIYDGSAKSDATFPYIVVDGWNSNGRDGLNYKRQDVTFLVHIFSNYKGNREVYLIAEAVMACLDRKQLQLDQWSNVTTTFDQSDVMVETNDTRHMWLRFSAVTARRL